MDRTGYAYGHCCGSGLWDVNPRFLNLIFIDPGSRIRQQKQQQKRRGKIYMS
jgi:hypothetical protein